MSRAASGALPATVLLLLVSCCTLTAAAAEIPCDRELAARAPAGSAVPTDEFHLRVVDLGNLTDATDPDLPSDLELERAPPVPDLSSRARSLAILKEIFGEAAYDDEIDVRSSPHDLGRPEPGADAGVSAPVRQPAASTETQTEDAAGDEAGSPDSEARLPGVGDEEANRYRRQMYRTDI